MEDLAIGVGLVLGVVCWWWLVRCMRINGRPWWRRHLAGLLLANFAMAGLSMLLASLLGGADESGELLGAVGVVGGLAVAMPMLIPLAVSWRAARRAPAAVPEAAPTAKPEQTSMAGAGTNTGHRLRFVYEDAKGNTSTRSLADWHDDGAYIEGYCLAAEDVRTFRRDRIISFLEGEYLLRPLAPKLDQGGKAGGAMEILFTGFPNDERSALEEDAESYGLVVRKTVTKNLDFVCGGPRAGSTKLAKARAQGCTILDEDDFWSLVEDGVMPE